MTPKSKPTKDWFLYLSNCFPANIPGEKAHLEMLPMRIPSSVALAEAKTIKESAVAIHIFEENEDLQIILTQRNIYDGAHSGQVSFPGGKKDEQDRNLEETARRESFEEINLRIEEGTLLGQLTEVYIPVSQFKVTPYLFYHAAPPFNLLPDPKEVQSIFYFPAQHFFLNTTKQAVNIPISKGVVLRDVPCFVFDQYLIWGATALIMNELKHILTGNLLLD